MAELDKKFKEGYISSFKDFMQPIRNQIIQAMREYLDNQKLYNQCALKL